MKVCSACGKTIPKGLGKVYTCSGCRMFQFCCKDHRDVYVMQRHDSEECHRCRERGMVAQENGFFVFPFDWYPKQGSLFDSKCAFFTKLGIHGKKPFDTDCDCISLPRVYGEVPILKKEFSKQSHVALSEDTVKDGLTTWWGKEGQRLILECDCLDDVEDVYDWESYFDYKRKALGSDAVDAAGSTMLAMVLDIPLTIFWCIKRYLRNISGTPQSENKEIRIIIAGPEKEHNQWPMLLELFNLVDGYDFDINMVGPELPGSMDGKTVEITKSSSRKRMKISFKRAELIGRDAIHLMNCDIVCALNAGLGAYPNWMETISNVKLFMGAQQGVKMFFFSDYVDESIEIGRKNLYLLFGPRCIPEYRTVPFMSHQDIQHVPNWRECAHYVEEHVRISQSLMNPFRKPLTCIEHPSHSMPYAPNGFGCFIELR